jgi:hypothetical protein
MPFGDLIDHETEHHNHSKGGNSVLILEIDFGYVESAVFLDFARKE